MLFSHCVMLFWCEIFQSRLNLVRTRLNLQIICSLYSFHLNYFDLLQILYDLILNLASDYFIRILFNCVRGEKFKNLIHSLSSGFDLDLKFAYIPVILKSPTMTIYTSNGNKVSTQL